MQKHKSIFVFVIILVAVAIAVAVRIPPRLGLDLRGGSQLTIQVKTTDQIREITAERLQDVLKIIENRVNGLGVSEAVVQTAGEDQISVQLPGVNDPSQAERVLGGTAQLEFRTQKPGTEAQFQVELQIRQQLQAEQAALKSSNGDPAAVQKNQESLDRSNAALKDLFAVTGFTGKTSGMPPPTNSHQWLA
ncbi:MAG: protein translocase subunit SecD, partial [Coleofasciculaceae cyanobacterium SM2_1_6]|nr:protein translocase subunit SecD [Coleofasciculaceae cyanobacterium SM2_1_6]